MLKNKMFLRGLGIGMFLAAVLIFFMQSAQSMDDASPINEVNMTEALLKEEAEELGFKLYPKDEQWYSEAQLQDEIEKAKDAMPAAEPNTETIHSFYISYMMSTTQVSEMLQQIGLISDKTAFLQQMIDQKLTDKLQVGVFQFTGTPSVDEIIKKITTPR